MPDTDARNTAESRRTPSAGTATGVRAPAARARRRSRASHEEPRVTPRHHSEDRALEDPGPGLPVVAHIHRAAPVSRVLPEVERVTPRAERQQQRETGVGRQVGEYVRNDARECQTPEPGAKQGDREGPHGAAEQQAVTPRAVELGLRPAGSDDQ